MEARERDCRWNLRKNGRQEDVPEEVRKKQGRKE